MAKSKRRKGKYSGRRGRKEGPTASFLSDVEWEANVQTLKDGAEELDDRLTEAASRVEGAAHVGCKGDDLEKAAQEFLDDEDLHELLNEMDNAMQALLKGARVDDDDEDDDDE